MSHAPLSERKANDPERRSVPAPKISRKLSAPESSGAGALRQRVGNQGIQSLVNGVSSSSSAAPLQSVPVQAKLTISQPGDVHEQEADRVASEVMRTPADVQQVPAVSSAGSISRVQRMCAECEEEQGKKNGAPVQRKEQVAGAPAVTPVAAANIHGLRGGGRALPAEARSFFEPRFGADFSNVRVHVGTRAEEAARSIGAKAFTIGNDIAFGSGQYSPESRAGRTLLAHELTHVLQQGGSRGTVQCDFAIQPPSPVAAPRALTPPQIATAIRFNERVLKDIPNSAEIIELIRDVLGVSPKPAVVDADFVNGVVRWQAYYRLTQDGQLGPTTAQPLFREIGAEAAGKGEVAQGPRYAPAGPINVARAAPRVAHFDMFAQFRSDAAKNILPSCCEIRQDIQWNAAFVAAATAAGNPVVPNADFPAAHPADTWIEDRDAAGRYGHRAGPFSDPGAGDHYLDSAGRQNQAFGHIYRGQDNPQGLAADRGTWRFRLRVIDVCNGNALLAVSPTLRVNWL